MSAERGMSLNALVAEVDASRPPDTGLSGALRIAVLLWFAEKIKE